MRSNSAVSGIRFKHKIFLCLPLLLGGFFLVRGLSLLNIKTDPQSIDGMVSGLMEGLYFMGALSSLFLSARMYRKLKKASK